MLIKHGRLSGDAAEQPSLTAPPVQVWLAALREAEQQEQQEPAEQRFICEDHFLPEDICRNQVSSEAIPIMPPCVGGGLGVAGPWGGVAEEEEEEDAWTMDADEEGEEEAAPAAAEASPSGQVGRASLGVSACPRLSRFHSRRLLMVSRKQLRPRRQRRPRRRGNTTRLGLPER